MELPEIRIRTLWVAHTCAICGREWAPGPAPYTVESMCDESLKPPHVVCDHCVDKHYPDEFLGLIRDRQRFWGA